MPFEVNTRIDISFTEEQIREALLNMVTEKFPDIEVEALDFVIRRNPTNISARIVASLVGYNSPSCSSDEEALTGTGNATSNGSTKAAVAPEPQPVEATASMFDAEPEDEESEEPEPEDAGSKEGTVAAILDL